MTQTATATKRAPYQRTAIRRGHDQIMDLVREGRHGDAVMRLETMPNAYRLAVAVCAYASRFGGGTARLRPRGEVLGIDKQAAFNEWVDKTFQHLDENRAATRAEQAEAAQRAAYGVKDSVYMRVVRKKVLTQQGYVVTYYGHAIAGMPDPSMTIDVNMAEPDGVTEVLHEAKFLYAQALQKAGVEKDWDKAKLRAANCNVELADLVNE